MHELSSGLVIPILDHGHTLSANHNEVFQWSICHCVVKSSSGGDFEAQGNYGIKELIELLVSLFNSLVCSVKIDHTIQLRQ